MQAETTDHLRNYRQLVERIDAWCRQVAAACPGEVTCHRGCDSCCRHLTLFPVEASAILEGMAALPAAEAEILRVRARRTGAGDPCPLLIDGSCRLYPARPLICRTHGLPLLFAAEGDRRIDYCPRNFRNIRTLPAAAVLDLDRFNGTLAGINALFLRESGWAWAERLYIAEVLNLSCEPFRFEK